MRYTGFLKDLFLDWKSRRTRVTLEIDAKPEDLEKLKDKKLTVEIKQYREKRTLDANAYYWQLLTKLSEVLDIPKPYLHNRLLRQYGQLMIIDGQAVYTVLPDTEEAEKAINAAETYHLKPTSQVKEGKGGKMYRTYMMLRGSSDYDTKEMSVLINGLVEECKEQGIETIPPDELRRILSNAEKYNPG